MPLRLSASLVILLAPALAAAPSAREIGPRDTALFPGGKEADSISGDFLLANDRVEAVISHLAPNRRANMSTFYGEGGITPGCLYDLTLRESENDQLTIFAPLDQRDAVSYVRIAENGENGRAIVETVVSAASNKGIFKRHRYILEDGWPGVLITTELRNESARRFDFRPADKVTNFLSYGTFGGIHWFDAVDPADKAGYAFAWVAEEGAEIPPEVVRIQSGKSITLARFLAVGNSPAEALGIVVQRLGKSGSVQGTITGPDGDPVLTAAIRLSYTADEKTHYLHAYPHDADGHFSFRLPPGKHKLEIRDHGRPGLHREIDLAAGATIEWKAEMEAASTVVFDVNDSEGHSLPCKVQFLGIEDTPSPGLGPNNRAHGCIDQYHSETGQFAVQLDPGSYRITITRGIEYGHHTEAIRLEPGQTVRVEAVLKRLVDTSGWVSADFHNHSTPSGDNTCGTPDRIINIAAEHIEFAPTTEHNRLFDWTPVINKLGLQKHIHTVPGIELTGAGAHFNSFPFEPHPHQQDGGAPVWQKDPRLNAVVLRNYQGENPDRWVQVNHPDMVENFIDRDGDSRIDGGYVALGQLIDGLETQNYLGNDILAGAPYQIVKDKETLARQIRYIREFIWLQLLNQGHRLWGLAVADAHTVYGNGVGSWRNYLPSSTDEPAQIDWRELVRHAKAGRMTLTTGPFLEVQTDDGTAPGGSTRVSHQIGLEIRVQCTDWLDIDRVQILVNGAQRKDLNFTRSTHPSWFSDGVIKFDRTVEVPLSRDSHLIVVAYGEKGDLSKGYGSSTQADMRPCAYNNPIFVDVDGNGFVANGDTLGHPLPVRNMTIGEVQGFLHR